MKLTARQVAVLEVLAGEKEGQERGMHPGYIGHLAGFERRQRTDAGTTKTLDSLLRHDYVKGVYGTSSDGGKTFNLDFSNTGRKWWITEAGRKALAEFAFGE